MSDPIQLSKAYTTRDEAAVAGFRRVLMNSVVWETSEFAFFVVLKLNEDKKPKYHYTTPQTDGSKDGVSIVLPTGMMVRAFCHTHPKSISTGNFSSGDLDQFKKLIELKHPLVFYLMNPQQQLRYALTEKEFMAGISLDWLKVDP
jgi:hypothetical protein